jgi:hypothetical protein
MPEQLRAELPIALKTARPRDPAAFSEAAKEDFDDDAGDRGVGDRGGRPPRASIGRYAVMM